MRPERMTARRQGLDRWPGAAHNRTVLSPRAVLDGTDWESLEHAYGPAADAPAHLVMLLSGDAEQCGEALAYLDAAILH